MGLAVDRGRLRPRHRHRGLGLPRHARPSAPKLEPAGQPRRLLPAAQPPLPRATSRSTRSASAATELWFVATALLLPRHARRRPQLRAALEAAVRQRARPGDRCHLNGMAMVDGAPRFVTALGADRRARRLARGQGERRRRDRRRQRRDRRSRACRCRTRRAGTTAGCGFLQSGKGELCSVDLETRRGRDDRRAARLHPRPRRSPGRSPSSACRRSARPSTFGGLPLVERLDERLCGVWVVGIESGEIVGFLRFEDLVQEVFDVALLPGVRLPGDRRARQHRGRNLLPAALGH